MQHKMKTKAGNAGRDWAAETEILKDRRNRVYVVTAKEEKTP